MSEYDALYTKLRLHSELGQTAADAIEALERKNVEYRDFLQQRLNRLLHETHAIGQSSKCDGCREATAIRDVLRDTVTYE